MVGLDGVDVQNARLAAERRRRYAFRVMRDVTTVVVPFDLQRSITLRHETRDERAVARVERPVELEGADDGRHCKSKDERH